KPAVGRWAFDAETRRRREERFRILGGSLRLRVKMNPDPPAYATLVGNAPSPPPLSCLPRPSSVRRPREIRHHLSRHLRRPPHLRKDRRQRSLRSDVQPGGGQLLAI